MAFALWRVSGVAILAVLSLVSQTSAMWTCSHGTFQHDWILFEDHITQDQTEHLIAVGNGLLRDDKKNKFIIDECMQMVSGLSIGWHDDHGNMNGMGVDDHITKKLGCEEGIQMPVRDKFARSAALAVCAYYGDKNRRSYRVDGFSRFFQAVFVGRQWARNNDCSNAKRTMDELLNPAKEEGLICWEFVRDVRDMLCHLVRNDETPEGYGKTVVNHPKAVRALGSSPRMKIDPTSGPVYLKKIDIPRGKAPVESQMCYSELGSSYAYYYTPSASQTKDVRARDSVMGRSADTLSRLPMKSIVHVQDDKDLDERLTPAVEVEGFSDEVCFGDFCADERSRSVPRSTSSILRKDTGVSFFNADDDSDRPVIREESAEPQRSGGSSNSASKMSSMSVVWTSAKSYKGSGYSHRSLIASAMWLEDKLGRFGAFLGTPLRLVAAAAGAMQFIAMRSLLAAAREFKVCPETMTDTDCTCKVIDPIINAVDDVFAQPPALDGDNKAITLTVAAGAGENFFGYSAGGGIYVTVYWQLKGRTTLGLEIGGFTGYAEKRKIGTGLFAPVGVHVYFELGIFYGLRSEMSAYSKGLELGIDLGVEGSIGIELLFRTEYKDIDYVTRCKPLNYGRPDNATWITPHTMRMILFPVNPVCVRGVAFSFTIGTGVFKFAEVNMYTSFATTKEVMFAQWERDNRMGGFIADSAQKMIDTDREADLAVIAERERAARAEAERIARAREAERRRAIETRRIEAEREKRAREAEAARLEAERIKAEREAEVRAREAAMKERALLERRAAQERAAYTRGLKNWASGVDMEVKKGLLEKESRGGVMGYLRGLTWQSRLFILTRDELIHHRFSHGVDEKDGQTGMGAGDHYPIASASIDAEPELSDIATFKAARVAPGVLQFTVTVLEPSGSSKDLHLRAPSLAETAAWVLAIENKISLARARAVSEEWYEMHDRFHLVRVRGGHQLIDNTVANDVMLAGIEARDESRRESSLRI